MTPALALFLFGLLLFLSPAITMWLDGYRGNPPEELIVSWLMSKTPEQLATVQACAVFGPFIMAFGAVHP
jgi:hypothetical protein